MKNSIYAGILIGLAGWMNLIIGGIPGAILFTLGLLLICYQDLELFTGKSGSAPLDFLSYKRSLKYLGKILMGNIIGTAIIAILVRDIELVRYSADVIITDREYSNSIWSALAKGIGCGALMEFAVWGWKEKKTIIPMFLCVPGFILTGMHHCIADSFYILSSSFSNIEVFKLLPVYLLSIVGNFIGCNIRRIMS